MFNKIKMLSDIVLILLVIYILIVAEHFRPTAHKIKVVHKMLSFKDFWGLKTDQFTQHFFKFSLGVFPYIHSSRAGWGTTQRIPRFHSGPACEKPLRFFKWNLIKFNWGSLYYAFPMISFLSFYLHKARSVIPWLTASLIYHTDLATLNLYLNESSSSQTFWIFSKACSKLILSLKTMFTVSMLNFF